MSETSHPYRVAITGCGAVTRLYYAPALAELAARGEIALAGAFDPVHENAEAIAGQHACAVAAADMQELLGLEPELVIVASPPTAHAAQAILALESGASVLCEKPFAPTLASAEAMVKTADRTGRSLSVGHVRRQFPAARAIRDILESGLIGDVRGVACFEGGPFEWPIAGPEYFSHAVSAGGVLQDLGPHCLDLLTWWLGPPVGHDCVDDGMGGVEVNCLVRLDYGSFTAEIRLSRDWARPNLYRIEGTRGRLEWVPNAPELLTIFSNRPREQATVRLGDADDPAEPPFHRYFERQILGAIAVSRGEPAIVPTGPEVLPLVGLLDECRRGSRPMPMPWFSVAEQSRASELRRHGAAP